MTDVGALVCDPACIQYGGTPQENGSDFARFGCRDTSLTVESS